MVKLGKKSRFLLIFWILFYFLVFGLLLRNSFSYLDPDLGWHLMVGQEIGETGNLPEVNVYNYTFTGNWVDHEWLINLTTSEIYNHFGYLSLNLVFALVIVLSLVLLNIFIRRFFAKAPEGVIAGLQFFGLIACLPHFGVRMQEFGFLFLLLEIIIIQKFSDDGNWKTLAWLPPLFYLWSNIHGSFLLGLGLLFIWPFIKIIERRLAAGRWRQYFIDNISSGKIIRIFGGFFLVSFLTTFFTPYGLKLYSFLTEYHNTFYLEVISEWLPQFRFPFNYWQLCYLALVVFFLGVYFFKIKQKKIEKIDLWQLSLVFLFLFLGFRSRRHFPLMFIVTFPFLIKTLYESLELGKINWGFFKRELKYLLLFCLGLVGLSQYINLRAIDNPFAYFCTDYPCQATEFLKQNTQYKDLNIFNEYNWGGYLIWTYPGKKLFIDGRIPQTEYAGHTFVEEYLEILKPNGDYAGKLKQYKVDLVLIKTEDVEIKAKNWEKFVFWIEENNLVFPNYLRQYLDKSPDWKRIYIDPLASIYLRIK